MNTTIGLKVRNFLLACVSIVLFSSGAKNNANAEVVKEPWNSEKGEHNTDIARLSRSNPQASIRARIEFHNGIRATELVQAVHNSQLKF